MSEAHSEAGHAGAHPPAEEDVISSGKIIAIGIISLMVFVIGSLITAWGMKTVEAQANPDGPAQLPHDLGKPKIGMVEQRLFENANQGTAWRTEARRRLESTGWVDREKGIVHIPIEKAMEKVEKGARP
jgi:hypothetical protein